MSVSPIKDNLPEFQKAIESKVSIDVDKNGNFYRVNWFMRFIYMILPCLETNRIQRIGIAFNKFLNEVEKSPARFSSDPSVTAKQDINVRICTAAAAALDNYLSTSGSSKVKKELGHLRQRVVALNYRYEAANGGCDKVPPPAFAPDKLRDIALLWKKSQKMMDNNSLLTETDETILKRVAAYPEFVKLLVKPESTELKERTFKAILRDNYKVAPEMIIEFPGMTDELYHSHMMTRLGYVPHDQQSVRVEKNANGEKRLELLVNGKYEHMHDLNRPVDCGGGLVLTFHEIFKHIKMSNYVWGDIEVLKGKGITKHSTIDLTQGTVKKGDDISKVDQTAMWNSLPVEEVISIAEAQRRFGQSGKPPCDGINWGGAIMATRKSKELEANGTHAYILIAEPDPSNGTYKIRTFGKSAVEIPTTTWETAQAVATTKEGRIISPDPCRKDPNRQHRGYPFTLAPADAKKGTDFIVDSILNGVTGNMAYNLMAGENCCKWDVDFCRTVGLPTDMFDGPFSDARPPNLLAYVHAFMMKMPYCVQDCFYQSFFFFLGSTTSRTVVEKDGTKRSVSLAGMRPWAKGTDQCFRIPAHLILKQEAGKLPSTPIINLPGRLITKI